MYIGYPKPDPKQKHYNVFVIRDLRNNDDNGVLGHMFDDGSDPHAFIIAPRDRIWIPGGSDDGHGSDDDDEGFWSNYPDAGETLEYFQHVIKIKDKLVEIFHNGDKVYHVDYAPMTQDDEDEKWDYRYNTERGKLMVQYMPAPKACEGESQGPQAPAK